jgi:hypothetical protein
MFHWYSPYIGPTGNEPGRQIILLPTVYQTKLAANSVQCHLLATGGVKFVIATHDTSHG